MTVNLDPKYYRLDQIPAYRLKYLEAKLKSLIQTFGLSLSDWPLNCFRLLKEGKAL